MKTLRQIIDNVNTVLKANYEKPVPPTHSSWYSNEKYREVYSLSWVASLIQKEFDNALYITYDRNVIVCDEAKLRIKVKKKKSDIISRWDYTNSMTIVEVYAEDEGMLDKTVEDFIQAKIEADKAKDEEDNRRVQEMKDLLENAGITIDKFLELETFYNKLPYRLKIKL